MVNSGRTFRVVVLACQFRGGADRYEQRRRRRGATETAKPAPVRAAQVEHAEVKTGRRLDEYGVGAHGAAGSRGAARMYSVRIAIASSSRGPAVLSTIVCSRASSLSTNSRGRMCSRVA